MAETYQGVYDIERGCMIAEKIAECHQSAKRLFGEKYTEKTQGIRDALQDLMRHDCNEVSAGLHLMKFLKKRGKLSSMAIMLISAVVYELCDSTKD